MITAVARNCATGLEPALALLRWGVSVCCAAALFFAPAPARAPGEGPEPAASSVAPSSEVGTLSAGGTENGALELGLGSAVMAIGVGLAVMGSVDLVRGLDRKRQCENSFEEVCAIDPPGLVFASTGLAYAFAVPSLVGGAILLAKGARIHRDFRAVRALTPRVDAQLWFERAPRNRGRHAWATRRASIRGGGVQVRVRF